MNDETIKRLVKEYLALPNSLELTYAENSMLSKDELDPTIPGMSEIINQLTVDMTETTIYTDRNGNTYGAIMVDNGHTFVGAVQIN